jgi:hypothetical protein
MERDGAGLWMVDRRWNGGEHCLGREPVGSCGQDIGPCSGHAAKDFGGLRRRFSGSVDDLRQAGTQSAVMVNTGVTEVFEWEVCETLGGGGRGEFAALNGCEKI